MCDREDDKDAEQEPEEIGDERHHETVRRSLPKGFTKSQGKNTTFSYPGPIIPSDDLEQAPSTSAVSNNFGPSSPVRIML